MKVSQVEEAIGVALVAGADGAFPREAIALQGGLETSLTAAVEANAAYRSLVLLEAEAFSNIDAAASARRTQVAANANGGAIDESGPRGGTTTGLAGGVSLSQLIFDAGESAATVNRATAQALVAKTERHVRGNELALEAARAWVDVWQFGARIALLNDRTNDMDTLVTQIERMADNGMVDRAALEGVRRSIVDVSLEEVRLNASLHEARTRFARYFNTTPAALERPAEIVTAAQARSHAQAWQEAPALRRQAAELLMARNNVTIAEAAFQPRARLEGGVRSPMDRGESTDTTIGVSLTYTLGDGGRRAANLRAAQARLEAAQAQLAEAQRRIEAQIAAALAQLDAIDQSMPLVAENIRLSAAEAEIARTQLVTGQSNLQRLIEAEIGNYRARDREIEMQAEKLELQLAIAALSGALGREIGLEQGEAE